MGDKVDRAIGYGATGAAVGSAAGPIGTVVGGLGGALYGYLSGGDDAAPPPPPPPQYIGGSGGIESDQALYGAPTNQFIGPRPEDNQQLQDMRKTAFDNLDDPELQAYMAQLRQTLRASAINTGSNPDSPEAIALQNQVMRQTLEGGNLPGNLRAKANAYIDSERRANETQNYLTQNQDLIGLSGMAAQSGQQQAQQGDFATAGARGMAAQNQARNLQMSQANNLLNNDHSGAGQQQLVSRLYDDMNGGQPSVAQIQLNQGAQTSLQQQAAMAASASPMNSAFAQKQAAVQGANVMGNLNQQQALLRAQEYAAARGQLGDTLNQQRQQYYLGQQTAAGVSKDARGQDLSALSYDYNNELQNAQMRAAQQQNNATNQQYYVGQYMGEQARRQAQAQQGSQFNAGQNLARDTSNLNASIGAGSNANAAAANSINQQRADDARTGSYMNMAGSAVSAYQQFNKPTAPAPTPAANGYKDPTIVNPYGDG